MGFDKIKIYLLVMFLFQIGMILLQFPCTLCNTKRELELKNKMVNLLIDSMVTSLIHDMEKKDTDYDYQYVYSHYRKLLRSQRFKKSQIIGTQWIMWNMHHKNVRSLKYAFILLHCFLYFWKSCTVCKKTGSKEAEFDTSDYLLLVLTLPSLHPQISISLH